MGGHRKPTGWNLPGQLLKHYYIIFLKSNFMSLFTKIMLPTLCNSSERYEWPGTLLFSSFIALIHVTERIYKGPFVLGLLFLRCGIETFHIFFMFFFFGALTRSANMYIFVVCNEEMHTVNVEEKHSGRGKTWSFPYLSPNEQPARPESQWKEFWQKLRKREKKKSNQKYICASKTQTLKGMVNF